MINEHTDEILVIYKSSHLIYRSCHLSNSHTSISISDPTELDHYLEKKRDLQRCFTLRNLLNKCRLSKKSIQTFHWISQVYSLLLFFLILTLNTSKNSLKSILSILQTGYLFFFFYQRLSLNISLDD